MTLPSSGTISIGDLRTEFSGPTPSSLSNYYRDGAYVPFTPVNSNVPYIGTISLSNFYGAQAGGGVTISLSAFGTADTGGRIYRTGFNVNSTGTITGIASNSSTYGLPQNWASDGGATASNYEVRLTVNSGPAVDNAGIWLNLGTTRQFSRDGGSTYERSTCTLEIRNAVTTNVKASCTVTLETG